MRRKVPKPRRPADARRDRQNPKRRPRLSRRGRRRFSHERIPEPRQLDPQTVSGSDELEEVAPMCACATHDRRRDVRHLEELTTGPVLSRRRACENAKAPVRRRASVAREVRCSMSAGSRPPSPHLDLGSQHRRGRRYREPSRRTRTEPSGNPTRGLERLTRGALHGMRTRP